MSFPSPSLGPRSGMSRFVEFVGRGAYVMQNRSHHLTSRRLTSDTIVGNHQAEPLIQSRWSGDRAGFATRLALPQRVTWLFTDCDSGRPFRWTGSGGVRHGVG